MPDARTFEWTCRELEEKTSLDRLESRGTVRLALKQSGLEANSVTPDQMKVVVERVLPGELAARGVDDGDIVCQTVSRGLEVLQVDAPAADSPDEVFRRLGG